MPSAKYKVDFVGCMKLIRFLASFLFLYAVLSLGVFAQNSEKPNILLILVDDLGYGDLSSYGSEDIESPRIDELMSQGIRFDQFYSDCTVCSPTRASLMTGLRPDQIKVYDLDRHFREEVPDVTTLSQHFLNN